MSKKQPIKDYQVGETVQTLDSLNNIVIGVIARKTIFDDADNSIRVLYIIHLPDMSTKACYVTPYRDDVSA